MCGRARCTVRPDDIPRACHRSGGPTRTIDIDRYRPAYNVSPGWNVPVVRRDDEAGNGGGEDGCSYAVHVMKWGLIPSFTKKTEKPDFYRMFNARAESVGEKASFRRLLPKNRCLVTGEGFYEWKKEGSRKQPYYIHFKDGRPLVFAALYDSWKNSEGEMLYTFTIITTSSSPALQWLHDRMPVILGDKGAVDMWLNNSSSPKLDVVLKPYEESDLGWYPVTTAMGKPSYDGPECVKEIQLKADDKGTISTFFSRKQIKEEQESEQEQSSTADDPHTTGNSTEEKYGCRDSVDVSETKIVGYESIPDTSQSKDDTKFRSKRDHEELPADGEPGKDSVGKLGPTPPRKKPNLKTATDKQQPTLLSFFGKK